jgi:nucleotide-binding universal stress UspA family protein
MDSTRWIVVGTDFSDGAAHALEQAVALAMRVGASVACVHAYEDVPGAALRDDRTPLLKAQLEETIATSCPCTKGVHIEPMLRRGPAWEKLMNVACELGSPVIVVGAHGEHAPHAFLGSVAARLAAIATRMVLIVPERAGVAQVEPRLAWSRERE